MIFLPSGGSGRLRRRLVDDLDIEPGARVLELGCGTGQVTARLVEAGAEVVAVDALAPMLARARRRAPLATLVEGDAIAAEVGGGYDRVVLAFLLHSFDRPGRVRLLRRATAALAPGGRVGVLDWALPRGRAPAALWRRFLRVLEPSEASTMEILDGALAVDLAAAGLRVERRGPAAGGRAQILVAAPLASAPF